MIRRIGLAACVGVAIAILAYGQPLWHSVFGALR
jgi:hypothetical protein